MYIHTFKQDFIVPATGNPSAGYILFPKTEFGLSYEVKPDPINKKMTVILWVSKLQLNKRVWPLEIYEITEQGFPTNEYSNQIEYDEYISQKNDLQNQINILNMDLEVLLSNLPTAEDPDIQNSINEKIQEISSATLQLNSLEEVKLEIVYINKYDDVIQYFKGDGSLTDEGIEWAKTVYYNGQLIGDLVE